MKEYLSTIIVGCAIFFLGIALPVRAAEALIQGAPWATTLPVGSSRAHSRGLHGYLGYRAPPSTGSLATLDPALLVTPPQGLEVGYVPIVTRQEVAPD
jgi:hypothetical protein